MFESNDLNRDLPEFPTLLYRLPKGCDTGYITCCNSTDDSTSDCQTIYNIIKSLSYCVQNIWI